jgi:hypothetical protein
MYNLKKTESTTMIYTAGGYKAELIVAYNQASEKPYKMG